MNPAQKEQFAQLIDLLKRNKYLGNTISLINFELEDAELAILVAAIKRNPKQNRRIQILDISQNNFTRPKIEGLTGLLDLRMDDCSALGLALDDCPSLLRVSAARNRLSYVIWGNITSIIEVDFHINHLTEVFLDRQTSIARVNLAHNRIQKLDLSSLENIICLHINGQRIRELYLGCNPLTERFDFTAAEMLEHALIQISARMHNKPSDAKYLNLNRDDNTVLAFEAEINSSNAQLEGLLRAYTATLADHKLKNACLRAARVNAYLYTSNVNALPRELALRIAMLDFLDSVKPLYMKMFKQLRPKDYIVANPLEPTDDELAMMTRVRNAQLVVDRFINLRLPQEIDRLCRIAQNTLLPRAAVPQQSDAVVPVFSRIKYETVLQRLIKANKDAMLGKPLMDGKSRSIVPYKRASTALTRISNAVRPLTWIAKAAKRLGEKKDAQERSAAERKRVVMG